MILLFTDFGWNGPYVGELKMVLARLKPDEPVIDLMHDAPKFDPRAAAYLLAALSDRFPKGSVAVAVVDPGVGGKRKAIAVNAGRVWLIGPDNGLLALAARRLGDACWYEIGWKPDKLSASFRGRDLFAPLAARIAAADTSALSPHAGLPVGHDWPEEHPAVVYVDGYGNLVTGLRPAGGSVLVAARSRLRQARTFSDVPPGSALWYENSSGLVEIAVNGENAAEVLGLRLGDEVNWVPADQRA